MKPRLQLFLLCAPLMVAGCYTQLRPPAEFGLEPRPEYSDYWADAYYLVPYYPAPWEVYPGSSWWYADYWPSYYEAHPYVPVDDSNVRHGWDRGPGSPYVPSVGGRVGGGSGGGGGVTVPAPAPAGDGDEVTPTPPEAVKPRDVDTPKEQPSNQKPKEEDKHERGPWGR